MNGTYEVVIAGNGARHGVARATTRAACMYAVGPYWPRSLFTVLFSVYILKYLDYYLYIHVCILNRYCPSRTRI